MWQFYVPAYNQEAGPVFELFGLAAPYHVAFCLKKRITLHFKTCHGGRKYTRKYKDLQRDLEAV